METAISNGDVLIWSVAVAAILAAVSYIAGSAKAYEQIGKAIFVMDSDITEADRSVPPKQASKAEREAEIRQMLEAKAYRQRERGLPEIDVEVELQRMLHQLTPPPPGTDEELVEEVRQMVLARNARLEAKGKAPLDVESEVSRRLAELENLGQ